MKVKELIEELKKFNLEADVILSSDPEGNSHLPVYELSECVYEPTDRGYVENIGIGEITPEMIKLGLDEDDILENGIPCVIIHPG